MEPLHAVSLQPLSYSAEFTLDAGNTAWILTSAALVLLMTPGLAFFYGGMVRAKTVLNMMMMSFASLGVVGVMWVLLGYGLAFGPSDSGSFVGNPFTHFGLEGLTDADSLLAGSGVPALVAVGFQATFAIITIAIISGAVADRVKFATWLVFAAVWSILAYAPMAHMVWGGGLLSHDGVFASLAAPVDFAGGTVVHINAGVAGLVLAIVVGKRRGFRRDPMRPHNLPFVMLGTGLLWFGWFGFNAGSAGAANTTAGLAFVNTMVAASAAILGWLAYDKIKHGQMTSLGAASGAVAGLVAITPAAGALTPLTSIIMGLVTGAICAGAVSLKFRFNIDDSLDVVGIHLVGGLVGTVLIGLLARDGGLFFGGGITLLLVQVLVALAAVIFSGVVTFVIGIVLQKTMGWRIPEHDEIRGIDVTEHAETAYDFAGSASSRSEVK